MWIISSDSKLLPFVADYANVTQGEMCSKEFVGTGKSRKVNRETQVCDISENLL